MISIVIQEHSVTIFLQRTTQLKLNGKENALAFCDGHHSMVR